MAQEFNTGLTGGINEAALTLGLEPAANYSREPKDALQLFEEHATRSPDQLAVVCLGRKWTYGELNARADQLAAHLRSKGVGPKGLVAISAHRSLEMVLAILGVLKTGGAYVPLDPAYPKERLEFMIADSQPALCLTQSHLANHLPGFPGETVLLDAFSCSTSDPDNEDWKPTYCAGDLAYVIYPRAQPESPKA